MAESVESVTVICDDPVPLSMPCCPLCNDQCWSRPIKVLDCGHSFCQPCLQSVYRRGGERCRIQCPTCGSSTPVVKGQLERLRTNFDLQHLLDWYAGAKDEAFQSTSQEPTTTANLHLSPEFTSLVIRPSEQVRILRISGHVTPVALTEYPDDSDDNAIISSGFTGASDRTTAAEITDSTEISSSSTSQDDSASSRGVLTRWVSMDDSEQEGLSETTEETNVSGVGLWAQSTPISVWETVSAGETDQGSSDD